MKWILLLFHVLVLGVCSLDITSTAAFVSGRHARLGGSRPTSLLVKAKKARVQEETRLEQEEVVGIGGLDGVVYNVNRLKRNLVQETVREYKKELWQLLGKPMSSLEEIETKLAALVQSNPVSTTTDSNLLEGPWSYAFGSSQSASDVLLDKERFVLKKKKNSERNNVRKKKQRHSGWASLNPFRAASRLFHLEELGDHEDPYMVDRVRYLGGFVTKSRKYNVMGLTRTDLDMDVVERRLSVCGKQIWKRRYPPDSRNPLEITVLYLDPDLCVSTISDGLDGPFQVYTKDGAWVGPTQRGVRISFATVGWIRVTLDKTRKAVWSIIMPKPLDDSPKKPVTTEDNTAVEATQEEKDESKLTVVKLGDLSATQKDNEAWASETDPFVHLSADERQERIKKMSFRQLERAKRRKERLRKRKDRQPVFKRIKSFKKPQEAKK